MGKILVCGLEDALVEKIRNWLVRFPGEYEIVERLTKLGAAGCFNADINIDCVILAKEMKSGPFSVDEILWFCDQRNVRVIPILSPSVKKGGFIKQLYNYHVYNAYISGDVRADDITASGICALIRQGRTPAEARQVYGL